ncbi:MAG: helicase-associated domain-containing protein, partial [Myxococcota bacterium]|nr:helicase-associated domain-containing protein [Myxococcota bacterium]
MNVRPNNPLIVQSDGKILLEAKHAKYEEVRDFLSYFSELESSPELLHTYRITPLSLWNAASSGMESKVIIDNLQTYSKFGLPKEIIEEIEDMLGRYGLVQLVPHPTNPKEKIRLRFETAFVAKLVTEDPRLRSNVLADDNNNWCILKGHRGLFKQRALLSRWPVQDLAGFVDGDHLDVTLRTELKSNGKPFAPRDYQQEAADRWFQEGKPSGGCGVVVLACGAGKTIVGITAMNLVNRKTLILATNQASVNQWIREILDKTELTADDVGAYTGESKEIKSITVATYQILTWRRSKNAVFEHLHLFEEENWGLV